MTETIRILVADDHPVVRDGLVAILDTQPDFSIVGEAGTGAELVDKARQIEPDIILTDLEMPELDGVEAIRQIRNTHADIAFIVFTAFDTDERIIGAVQAGAKGYLLKGAPRDEIFKAVRIVSQGGSLLEPVVASKLLQHISGEDSAMPESLTERETEVLQLLAQGKPNKAIAADLFITERTVKFYVSAILGKLGAGNRTEAVAIAAQRGLVKL
jgi:DNA-binding NarL/FixJ family response regulator